MERNITVSTPLPEGVLLLESMSGREELGRPFTYEVHLLSKVGDIEPADLLGQPMTVHVELNEADVRHFNGIVCRFDEVGTVEEFTRYRAVLRPWFFLLTNTANCRIFQKTDPNVDSRTVPNIAKQVCTDQQFKDIDLSRLANKSFREWEFLVQYRESDFNFISRMLEQEGIYYYFTHTADQHTLVLADSVASHDPVPGYEVVPYFQSEGMLGLPLPATGQLETFTVARQIQPGAYVGNDYNFESPRADRIAPSNAPLDHAFGNFEVYDYPGEFSVRKEGEALAIVRREESQVDSEVFQATGNTRGLGVGSLFNVIGHSRAKVNAAKFLVIGATYALVSNAHHSQGSGGPTYRCTLTVIDSRRSFRAASRSPRPTVQGPQTATVVGPKGEEIWTDKYGRVKVQFHWDRYNKGDENSSCWVRVAQVWAGAKWGAMHIPRIGQEVIVDFLEGDPDRPIITGRVYNEDNKPPYDLPNNQTQSGIKSRSTPKGGPNNFNELRFEDKKGSEELFIHAEKNQTTKVKNNQSISVDADRSVSVGGNESISVSGTRSSTITKKETQTFNDAREMTVAKTDTVTITEAHTGTYIGGRTETVDKGDTLTVNGSDKTTTVHGQFNITADAQFQVTQGANKVLVKNSVDVDSEGQIHLHNPKCSVDLKDGKVVITAAEEITLECGSASISLKKDGTIEINGSQKVKATGGGSGVELVAAGATMSGTKTTMSGTALAEITGAIVKIN